MLYTSYAYYDIQKVICLGTFKIADFKSLRVFLPSNNLKASYSKIAHFKVNYFTENLFKHYHNIGF